jgi:hypothetical protein
MGEWMAAEVHVRVPDDVDIDAWLCTGRDRYRPDRQTLTEPPGAAVVTSPVRELLAVAAAAGFEWEWEPERRLLCDGDSELEVSYGLGEQFCDLADVLHAAGWAYRFASAGKDEFPGECWEWTPGWPIVRTFVQSGGCKGIESEGLRDALDEAPALGVDPAEHLAAWLAPWIGWTACPDP